MERTDEDIARPERRACPGGQIADTLIYPVDCEIFRKLGGPLSGGRSLRKARPDTGAACSQIKADLFAREYPSFLRPGVDAIAPFTRRFP